MFNVDDFLISTAPLGEEAIALARRGWFVVPLCWPDAQGVCACGHGHKKAGKVPLVYGFAESRATAPIIRDWWQQWPSANLGILLAPSNLLVIDLDDAAALAEAQSYGLPETLTVSTGAGQHYYYACPADFPKTRITQQGSSKKIDLLTLGFTVAPPSLHRSGLRYAWSNFDRAVNLPSPPKWVFQMLTERQQAYTRRHKETWKLDPSIMRSAEGQLIRVNFDPNTAEEGMLREALRTISSADYNTWYKVGMALSQWDNAGNGAGKGFDLWDEWSRSDASYPGRSELSKKWQSFRRASGNTTNVGKVFGLAKENGFSVQEARQRARDFDPNGIALRKGSWFKF